ncbi:hypothetical protein FRB99_005625 [Tulasnella sp. 403]|nr:hypothetical protein FRB99_005625 [Tulasnella sp. 403]
MAYEQLRPSTAHSVTSAAVLCLFILSTQDQNTVYYYYVDHTQRSIFWDVPVGLSELGLLSIPLSDLRPKFLVEYWTHVGLFPGNQDVSEHAEQELWGILTNYSIDDVLAPVTTSPRAHDQGPSFQELLRNLQALHTQTSKNHRTVAIAGLWCTTIEKIQSKAHNGTPLMAANSSTTRSGQPESYASLILQLAEAFTLGTASPIHDDMVRIVKDNWVDESRWGEFSVALRRDWVLVGGLASASLILNAVISCLGSTYSGATIISSGAALMAILPMFALRKWVPSSTAKAPEVALWIQRLLDYRGGLHPAALVLSLPRMLALYSFFFLNTHLLVAWQDSLAPTRLFDLHLAGIVFLMLLEWVGFSIH